MCAVGSGPGYALEVQDGIRNDVAGALRRDPRRRARGVFDSDQLIALSVWHEGETEWWSTVLAVRIGYRKQGIARGLKRLLLTDASNAGAQVVVSQVHYDNDAMLKLNADLGGRLQRQKPKGIHFDVVFRTA